MPRRTRIEFPGALYHITSRGARRAAVVVDDKDRARWMNYLKEAVRKFGLELHAFVLMDNHFHLFLATPNANLGKAMQYLNGSYAMFFNSRHRRSGHLFDRRYYAVLVEKRGHYTEISRYVHLNPVRAGMAARPEQYAWSSYPGYYSGRKPLPWLDYDRVLAEFGDGKQARERYRQFVSEGVGKKLPPPWRHAIGGWLLGGRSFAEKIRGMLAGRRAGALKQLRREYVNANLPEIAAAVTQVLGMSKNRLTAGGARSRRARNIFIFTSREKAGFDARTVAEYLHISHDAARKMAARMRKRVARNAALRKSVKDVEHALQSVPFRV